MSISRRTWLASVAAACGAALLPIEPTHGGILIPFDIREVLEYLEVHGSYTIEKART